MRIPFTTHLSEGCTQLEKEHRELRPQRISKKIPALSLCVACTLCAALCAGCGRKGPPLPPLVRLPGPVVDLTAKRFGDEVVLQFTIPSVNVDGSRPADLDRVEVYAHTGPLPTPADFLKYGELIANIAVKPPGLVGSKALPGLEEGAKASASEKVTPAEIAIGKMPRVRRPIARAKGPVVQAVYETPETVNAVLPVVRYFMTVGVSRKNQRGAFSPLLAVPLYPPLPAPGAIEVRYTQDELSFAWSPLARDKDMFVPAAVYNLYEVSDTIAPDVAGTAGLATDTQSAPASAPDVPSGSLVPAGVKAPSPLLKPALNPAPLEAPAFKQPQVAFGVRRCYIARAARMAGLVSIEGEGSPPTCLTPVDTFPPAAPHGLAAVTSEAGVSLIWEPNTEKDLSGYLVLRGETGAQNLTPITPGPVRDTTYRDTTVKSGASYDYVVVAVDDAPVPNISEYSNRQTAVVP